MNAPLHLIIGPTTTGKTGRSVELAQQTGASVISLDRIQCHSELSVGSGRPSDTELRATRRYYLCDRPVADGELPAAQANLLLHDLVEQLRRQNEQIILEGGSMSLLAAINADAEWNQYEWTVERLRLPTANMFRAKACTRVCEMLQPAVGPSMLDEAVAVSCDPDASKVLRGIVGYRTLFKYADHHDMSLTELARCCSASVLDALVDAIIADFLAYAKVQELTLRALYGP